MLLKKLELAAERHDITQVAIAGGVSANSGLREELSSLAIEKHWELFIPDFQYCTDNAGMIAMSGHLLFEKSNFGSLADSPLPRMPF